MKIKRKNNNSHEIMKSLNHEIENYSWGVLQDIIEREVNAAFKIREKVMAKQSPKGKDLKKDEKQ